MHCAVNKRVREKVLSSDITGNDMSFIAASVAASPPPISSYFSSSPPIYPTDDRDSHGSKQSHSNDSTQITPGLCALKLINKDEFWKQVESNLERKDTLVREVLAQSYLLNSIIACGPSDGYVDELSLYEMELPIVQINGVFESRLVNLPIIQYL